MFGYLLFIYKKETKTRIKQQLEDKDKQIEKLQNQNKELALAGINRPTTNTTNNNNNKIIYQKIEKLDPLNYKNFKDYLPQLKSHHIENGAAGLAEFAMEGPTVVFFVIKQVSFCLF